MKQVSKSRELQEFIFGENQINDTYRRSTLVRPTYITIFFIAFSWEKKMQKSIKKNLKNIKSK